MSQPQPATLEREQAKLYLTDAELIRWLGLPAKRARLLIPELERKFGFPRKQKLFLDRRYRPAVKAWLDRHGGLARDTNDTK
jgi:hypothetical protein